ncbi:MAG: hypothetical protein ACYC6I_02145 [Bacillota bacterium]
MGGDLFTVNRLVPADAVLGPHRSQRLLSLLRSIVRDIRRVNPEIKSYHLYDLSFQRRDDKIDIRLYFHGDATTGEEAESGDGPAPTAGVPQPAGVKGD